MQAQKVVFLSDDRKVLNVVRLGDTTNSKIASPKEVILQTYHFDMSQIKFVANGGKGTNLKTGFLSPQFTSNNCMSCPMRFKGCYTFHPDQSKGNLSMIRSIVRVNPNLEFSTYNSEIESKLIEFINHKKFTKKYIRFGTYGCPTNMPIQAVELLATKVGKWTGYSHEWHNPAKSEYFKYFMASSHSDKSMFNSSLANAYGFRTFETDSTNGIYCPSYRGVTCANCGLCSGTVGKGKTNIVINKH
jgi:hypothetical protein